MATLCRHLDTMQDTIAVIQEPWIVKSRVCGFGKLNGNMFTHPTNSKPRSCIYVPKHITSYLMPQLSTSDITVVRLTAGDGIKDTILASVYLPHDAPTPTRELEQLVLHCEMEKLHLVIGCDANSHHIMWGSMDTNNRGESLHEFIICSNLEILNRGTEPTFVTTRSQTVIDITLATSGISNKIHDWHVSTSVSMSDHRWIKYTLTHTTGKKTRFLRNPRLTDRNVYADNLSRNLRTCETTGKLNTVEDIETYVNTFQHSTIKAYKDSCPARKLEDSGNATAWWCGELDHLRRAARKSFNKAKNSKLQSDWMVYKNIQHDYKKLIRQRQRTAWRSFCEEVETTSAAARLKKILSKDPSQQIGCLKREDGSYTAKLSEATEILINTHFPGCTDAPDEGWSEPILPNPSKEDWEAADHLTEGARITWAIKSFSPFKAPGLDGIFPALLQWGLDISSAHLAKIFRACIAFRYIPLAWREVKVIFIPKPGRIDYTLAKSYRPISLTSFLLKTLEKLCERSIRETALTINPIHANQHAYTQGKSTESALHTVVDRIERSLDNKMSTLGVFIDIEGAFDKTTFRKMETALSTHGANPTVSGWIKSMLEKRAVTVNVGNATVRKIVAKGCPQGGVLSPLLWNIVVDSLLRRLNDNGFHTTGYADDITILLTGRFETVLCNLMQEALKIIELWCNDQSLTINPSKTEMVLFTRKRKLGELKLPKLLNTRLALSSEVKYLGVILDSKLTWEPHLKTKCKKACVSLWQCRRAVGQTWGLSPKIALWLYTAVVRPMLTYGAVVWWPRARQKTSAKQLTQLQRLACLSTTGAMRTTPTAAMEAMLCLPPLDLYVEEMATAAALRLNSVGLWYKGGRAGRHCHLLEEAVRKTPFLGRKTDNLPPCYVFNRPYNVSTKRGTGSANGGETLQIYTDGSKTKRGSGAGIYSHQMDLSLAIPLGKHTTTLQAEIVGITHGAKEILHRDIRDRNIQILTDSRAAILAVSGHKITSRLVIECHNTLKQVAQSNKIELRWVKGHNNEEGNSKADELARTGSALGDTMDGTTIAPTPKCLTDILKQNTLKTLKQRWDNTPGCRQAKEAMCSPNLKTAEYYLRLSRGNLRLITGILTGHCQLRKHLHTMGLVETPICRACEEEDETVEHVLTTCPALAHLRESMLGELWPNMANIRETPPSAVLSFARHLGWLEE